MRRVGRTFAGVILCLGFHGLVWAQGGKADPAAASFAVATVHFEQNVVDEDAEVVVEAMGEDGLAKLTVRTPDGRTVIDFSAPGASTLGMRQFRFESPEPKDIKALKSAYPAGIYTFDGVTASGKKLRSTATLTHQLPAAVSLLRPFTKDQRVTVSNLSIDWKPAKGLAAYVVVIEQPDMDVSITAKLPGSAHGFKVPDGFLKPGTAYQLGIGTVTGEGNSSFVETMFTTADKP